MYIAKLKRLLNKLIRLLKGVEKESTVTLIILLFQGITQGVGLLFIIPLLNVIGVSMQHTNNNGIQTHIEQVFSTFHIPLNLVSILCLYLTVLFFYAFLKYFQSNYSVLVTSKVTQVWRDRLFYRLNYSSWEAIQKTKISDLQEILTIETRKLGLITNNLIHLASNSILTVVYLIVSFTLSLKLTLLSALPIGLIFLINRKLNKKTYKIGQSSITKNLGIQAIIHECLGALRLVKSYSNEQKLIEEFKKINAESEEHTLLFTKANSFTKLVYELAAALIITIYIYIAIQTLEIPITQLLLLILIFSRLLPRASSITNNFQQLLNNIPAFEIILKTDASFDAADQITDIRHSVSIEFKDQILFSNIAFSHQNKKIFTAFNAAIKVNKTTLILGPSGVGKSTLIDLILGIRDISGGAIFIDQKPYTSLNLRRWKELIGYVPQESFLFHDSIFNNMRWAKNNATENEIWEVLKQVSAYNFVSNLPKGIHTVVGERGTKLSGGERQRIALARAILRSPQILILDEATNAIDDFNENLIKETLRQLNGKMTIIFVAHRSELTDLADHVIEIN